MMDQANYFSQLPRLKTAAIKVIDLRSPKEFVHGHMPRAHNIPLLDDNERHGIGCLYKQQGRLCAIQVGLELFSKRADVFLNEIIPFINYNNEIAIHCYRGGMRSQFVAVLLRSIGYQPLILTGGYKFYRKQVLQILEHISRHQLIVLHGQTGVGKTDLLRRLPANFPKLDFEKIANHRGSAFGDLNQKDNCPSQQNFENQLANEYLDVSWSPTILVEIERNLGPIIIPPKLRQQIINSPKILLKRTLEQRIDRIAQEYITQWNEQCERKFLEKMQMLKRFISKTEQQEITNAVLRHDFKTAIKLLLALRYDKVYDKSIKHFNDDYIATFDLTADEANIFTFLNDLMPYSRAMTSTPTAV